MYNSQPRIPIDIFKGLANSIRDLDLSSCPKEVNPIIVGHRDEVVSSDLFVNTRGYLEKLVSQINATYQVGCFDACSLLTRKLVEILIIEIYENKGRVKEITYSGNNQLFGLEQLITTLKDDDHWKLNRDVVSGLDKIKEQGDKAAHNRRYNSIKKDVDKIRPFLRDISEELLYLSQIKK